ncbi:uncharacterized protein A1O5_10092 [Cladophialophora psammophila CBS 110553]|uniref:Uncharacterized protein n=1 Tax=Cladophialophora psammophila CBS 110553 TaxID=1182543 RepID=W9WFM6_9EURO|nr:uncharacterized protein A1O5_10092 [Cladophialophora psammophila CBS 110553]EXJ66897.1 hypothetical protein A1O5_10092 [Cladophialophora psammophila CBS 110553]
MNDLTPRGWKLQEIHYISLDGWQTKHGERPMLRTTALNYSTMGRGLLELMRAIRVLEISDERDRIYSLLGHPSASYPTKTTIVLADYSIDLDILYIRFAKRWLGRTKNLNIISSVHHTGNSLDTEFPSWVPRWDVPGPCTSLDHPTLRNHAFNPQFSMIRDKLRVRGVVLDEIDYCSPIFPEEDDGNSWLEYSTRIWDTLMEWELVDGYGSDTLQAYLETLSADAPEDGPLFQASDRAAFGFELLSRSNRRPNIPESLYTVWKKNS